MTVRPVLNQIALSAVDIETTEAWFREGLGFVPAGGSRLMMSLPFAGKVQGLPGAKSTCWWLVADNPWFQLEIFQFARPLAMLKPADFRPCDIGYTRMSVHVESFDETLARLAALGSLPVGTVLGAPGARRACVRSPDNVFVEIMEADPLPDAPRKARGAGTVVRSVSLSTPDLDASLAYFTAITGQAPYEQAFRSDEDEALWGLDGARTRRATICCGDVLLELVEYFEPLGRPWPEGYRISDQGILNLGFGLRDRAEHGEVYERILAFGARSNRSPMHMPTAGMVYVNDALGFSAELLWIKPGFDLGYEPAPMAKRPRPWNCEISSSIVLAEPLARLWGMLGNHVGLGLLPDAKCSPLTGGGAECERIRPYVSRCCALSQVTRILPNRLIAFRDIEGGPFLYHNGTVAFHEEGKGTRVTLSMRYRTTVPFLGILFRRKLQKSLDTVLRQVSQSFVDHAG